MIYILLPTHSSHSLESHADLVFRAVHQVFIWIIFMESDFFFLIFNAAIHEFPEDIFTNRQRTQGAVLLHIFAVGEL